MDTELELEQEPQASPAPPQEELTDEQKATLAEQERQRRDAQYEQFRPFMEAFDNDPTKAFKAAMDGRMGGQPKPETYQGNYPPEPQPQTQLTEEQLREANAKVFAALAENPLGVLAQIEQRAEQRAYDRVTRDAAPILESNGERIIRDFKADQRDKDPFYKMVLGEFEEELKDLPPSQLITMSADQQRRELDRRYYAAQGKVLSRKVKPRANGTTSAGNGVSVAPSRNGGAKVVELTAGERAALLRNLGPDKGAQAIKDIEEGRA